MAEIDTIRLNEARMILVGDAGVGKTSLINMIVGGGFDKEPTTTQGISIRQWLIENTDSSLVNRVNKIGVKIWDFGGQEIMFATHQFFLTRQTLYLLVIDSRRGIEESRMEYWLKIIRAFGGNSPIIIAVNKTDERSVNFDDIKWGSFHRNYPSIVKFVETSAKTGAGIDELKTYITQLISSFSYLQSSMPASWLAVREQLKALRENYISQNSYSELCIREGIDNLGDQNELLTYLSNLGLVVSFRDNPSLQGTIVINPEWITNAVYELFYSNDLSNSNGVFLKRNLSNILNLTIYPPEIHDFLIDVMLKFELCFEYSDSSEKIYLIPYFLPQNELFTGKWESHLMYLYQYAILPSSVISRFIVRMHGYISENFVWRLGVLIRRNGNTALVKAEPQENQIFIGIGGNENSDREFLSDIRAEFEFIHSTISGLEVTEKIPHPIYPDIIFDYRELKQFLSTGITELPRITNGETIRINIRELLDEIDLPSRKLQEQSQKDNLNKAAQQSSEIEPQLIEINRPFRVINDQTGGPDQLNYSRYANAFAELITNPDLSTPVTIGIYGPWGAGKSFLMGKIKETINPPPGKSNWYDLKNRVAKFHQKRPDVNLHIIEFNAWVYSGSEHLWASLVTHLYRDIEKHFGLRAHTLRLRKAIKRSLPKALGAFAFYALLGLGLSVLLNYNEIQTQWDAAKVAVNAVAGSLLGGSALASLPVLWTALKEFFDSMFLSRANKLQNLAARPDFKTQIGIMADIKGEIKFLRELLKKGQRGKPTRLVLLIDDLDRCEHRKAVEVLQAIMLLLADEDGSPFVIFLGIDARVVVRAIEEHYGEVLVKAGINGYEYLDKIIQIPFVIPAASKEDIGIYVDSMLYASKAEKDGIEAARNRMEARRQSALPVETAGDVPQRDPKDYPELPTAALLGDVSNPNGKPDQTEQAEQVPVTFTEGERDALKACVNDLVDNPRKIKRIVNIYRLARLLIPASLMDREKVVRWILMTEQWPLHMAWILEWIENDAQTEKKLAGKSLSDVYHLARKTIHAKEMEILIGIDTDHHLFEQFIQKEPIFSVKDVLTLLPLTFNLNPAVRSEVGKHALRLGESEPETTPKRTRNTKKKLPPPADPVISPN